MSTPAVPTDRLYAWLPAFHRRRDALQGYPLRALLRAIGEQVDLIEDDIGQLYADWFIETCADWAVPYIGELVGYRPAAEAGVAGDDATAAGRQRNAWLTPRREVANTIALRRRKGTLHVLEHLARDVAGWPALATEYFRALAWAQNVNHPHLERARTARLGGPRERRCDGDGFARTVDLRRIDSNRRRGLYHPANVGLTVYRLAAYPVSATQACCVEDIGANCFTFSVFGNDAPLFAVAPPCGPCAHAGEGIPQPLTRAQLQEPAAAPARQPPVSAHYYGAGKAFAIHAPGWPNRHAPQPVPARAIVVADLSDWTYSPARDQVAVDPERGRIAFPPAQAPRQGVRVDYHYGFSAPIGGGEYVRARVEPPLDDRARFDAYDILDAAAVLARLQHRGSEGEALSVYLVEAAGEPFRDALDAWAPNTPPPVTLGEALVAALDHVLADEALYDPARFPAVTLSEEMHSLRAAGDLPSLRRFNRLLLEAAYPAAIAPRFRYYAVGSGGYERLADALRQWREDAPRYGLIEFLQSGAWTEPVNLFLQAHQTLQLRAAERVRPVLRLLDYMADRADAFRIAGARGSRVVLDGLVIGGRGIQVRGPEAASDRNDSGLCELTIRHCTLVPGWDLGCDCEPKRPNEPSIEMNGSAAALRIEHSILGAIELAHDTTRAEPNRIAISDSVLDATRSGGMALHGGEGRAAHAVVVPPPTTVFGAMRLYALELAENSIFTGCVEVARRQIGCMRFCYAPRDSRTPRRYHCQPDGARRAAVEALLDEAREAGLPEPGDADREAAALRAQRRVRPRFTSRRYGNPGYAQLALEGAPEIARGADDESELGVFHDLFQPQRAANLRVRLDEYTPAGMAAGIFYAT